MSLTSVISGDQIPSAKLVNHIIFLIDSSGSMSHRLELVKRVFDSTLKSFKDTKTNDQDINISVYDFNTRVNRIIYNQNLSNMNTSISFRAHGLTALRDAIDMSISDHLALKQKKDEDHSFLIYAITDGQDNASNVCPSTLSNRISSLDDSWTVAALVPSATDAHHAKTSGIPAGNIEIWNANSSNGFEEVGKAIASSYQNYSVGRSAGVRSTSSIFAVNVADVARKDVRTNLSEIKGSMFHAQKEYVIKEMAEQFTSKPYVKGSVFYELSKLEIVQPYKEIVIVSKKDLKKFGGADARDLLGLPHGDAKMKPGDFGDWRIFIQSTSYTRKIKPGTSIFVKD